MHILIGLATSTSTSDCIILGVCINQQSATLLARSSQDCAQRQVSLLWTSNVIKRPNSLSAMPAVQGAVQVEGDAVSGTERAKLRARC
jgi:hypothetical protein